MLSFPLDKTDCEFPVGLSLIQRLGRYRIFNEDRQSNKQFFGNGFHKDQIADDDNNEDGDELVPLNKTQPSSGKRQKYGAMSMKKNTTRNFNGIVIHELHTHDTLAGISIKYNSNVEDIKRVNGIINESDIWLHTKLKIPIMKTENSDWRIATEQNHAEKFVDFGWPNEVMENPPESSKSPPRYGFSKMAKKETIKSPNSQSIKNVGNLNSEVWQSSFDPELVGNENWSGDCVMWAQVAASPTSTTNQSQIINTSPNLTVTSHEADPDVDNFFANFDKKTAHATEIARKSLQKLSSKNL